MHVDQKLKMTGLAWYGWLLVVLMALSSLSSKALGAAWLVLVLVGLHRLLASYRFWPSASRVPSWPLIWLGACAVALALKSAATIYWQDPWPERHGEIRMLFGALAVWGWCHFLPPEPGQFKKLCVWLSHALTLTALLGLCWVLYFDRTKVTTHPIPWAGIMAVFSCWLLAMGLNRLFSQKERMLWLAGSFIAMLAVLASQSRGAFVLVPWWGMVAGWVAWRSFRRGSTVAVPALRRMGIAAGLLVLVLTVLAFTPVLERPRTAIMHAIEETQRSRQNAANESNSSFGARLYMWQRSVEALQQNPWSGYGHDGRKALIKQWADDAESTTIRELGHVHNEYLHQWIDHGVLGLTSVLAYVLGLLAVTVQFFRSGHATAGLALAGTWVMYVVGNLSNVNFAHNYYTAGLSLMTSLIMVLMTRLESSES